MTRGVTARLFIAIDPPVRVREALCAWARGALGPGQGGRSGAQQPVRLLAPELLHLTICFLGSRPLEEIEAIVGALEACATPVGELSVGAPLWLPPRRPRALAVELHDPTGELSRLHDEAMQAIAGATGWEPEEARSRGRRRRFRPHITLARMREGAAPRARELPPTPQLAFTPQQLTLYRSWLSPEGAEYEALGHATLVPA
ncbi:MAG TPA: RNA 2',3'-cyclic phosphodiesterase [Solirubrobacteraceae bacterium]|jgi:2'-5' RNA ligase|nr:RNA 2',3'-cyclic phosphodiesterase [Solirubrobacteraceae bacterium]